MNKIILVIAIVLILVIGAGFFVFTNSPKLPPTSGKVISEDPVERIYNLDPQRKYIGKVLSDLEFEDVVSGKTIKLSDLSDKVIIMESFSVGCPACAEGIKNYNQIYDTYGDKVQIIYLNINPADSSEDILNIKQRFNGRDWIWVKYSPKIDGFYSEYGINGNDITYMIKNNIIQYADGLSAPLSRIGNNLKVLLS